jgi:hypothetical protein
MGALLALAGLGLGGCTSPAAAIPLAMSQRPPTAIAVPNEDGSHYILVEAGSQTPVASLPRLWKKKATKTCQGDFIVLSAGENRKKTGGVLSAASYEGWVRCISPEVADDEARETAGELDASA